MSAAPMDLGSLQRAPEFHRSPEGRRSQDRATDHPRPALVLVPPIGPPPAGGLQLTRAGRLVATLLATAVVVAGAAFGIGGPGAATTDTHPVTVQPGQTLSQIAARELPGARVSDAVADIAAANNLASTQVRAGQVLLIPAGG